MIRGRSKRFFSDERVGVDDDSSFLIRKKLEFVINGLRYGAYRKMHQGIFEFLARYISPVDRRKLLNPHSDVLKESLNEDALIDDNEFSELVSKVWKRAEQTPFRKKVMKYGEKALNGIAQNNNDDTCLSFHKSIKRLLDHGFCSII